MLHRVGKLILSAFILVSLGASIAVADPPPPQFIDFGGDRKGALYFPDPALFPAPSTGVLVIHRTSNFLDHTATGEFPERGFVVLGMNPHSDNNEAAVEWEQIADDVRRGVEYLYNEAGMTQVVLFGHSGGGPTTSYYQAVAENGLGICQGANKIVECPNDNDLVGPPADAIILIDAHPGNTVNRLRSFNAAVNSETNAGALSSNLNPFLEKNGYNPDGCSSYSEDFKTRYFEAQATRMNRLIDEALAIKADMEAGKYFPPDDDVFTVHRRRARLMQLDDTIHGSTEQPQKLLLDNGTIDDSSIVQTVRPCSPNLRERDGTFSATVAVTVNSFLGATAIRSTNSLTGIDWCSSNNSTPCMVQSIEAPTLVLAMAGHYFVRDGEQIFEMSASSNKDFVVIDGATHGLGNCGNCTGGPYLNARKNMFDLMAKWINTGFTPVTSLP